MFLARDMQTSLITFDLEDLEDLGLDFNTQEQKSHAAKSSLAEHYFASPSLTNETTEVWEQSRIAFSVVLDAVTRKSNVVNGVAVPAQSQMNLSIESQPSPPSSSTIIHVREATRMVAIENGYRFFARLDESVKQRRQEGESIIVVVTISDVNAPENGCPSPLCAPGTHLDVEFLAGAMAATVFSRLDVDPLNMDLIPIGVHLKYTSTLNKRRLKHALRRKISHLFAPEALHPYLSWSYIECDISEDVTCLGKWPWTSEEIQHAVTRITGRSWGKSQLGADDIRAVLVRLGLHDHAIEKNCQQAADDSNDAAAVEDLLQAAAQKRREKIEEIRWRCGLFEPPLLSSIVDIGKKTLKAFLAYSWYNVLNYLV